MTINKSKTYLAHFTTTAGNFVVKLDAATAPITTNNFVFLATHNYYKCVIFHRAIPGFMIQGGDPTGTGSGGPGYTIADEDPTAGNPTYPLYSIAMANENSPHTGGSQFFIVTGTAGETLPATYSLFGQVVGGVKAVTIIQNAGNPSQAANGVPPLVVHRILNVTISES
jgi:cyclophilin family peptidyl-prolyl cis-trans isomerase